MKPVRLIKKLGLLPSSTEYIKEFGMVQNPYYVGFLYPENSVFFENTKELIKHKKAAGKKFFLNGDYEAFVFNQERPFRLNAFLSVYKDLEKSKGKKHVGRLLGDVWIDAESPSINQPVWRSLFNKYGRYAMTKKERKKFNALPDSFTVYRGATFRQGMSWTLSEEVAKFFASRWNNGAIVFTKTVKKSDCLCLLTRRDEEEIILNY